MGLFDKMKFNSLMKKARQLYEKRERGENVDVSHEIKAYRDLANFYQKQEHSSSYPNARLLAIESLRAAAILGDPDALYQVGKYMLEMGRFWTDVSKEMLAQPIHETYAKQAFSEAFDFLTKAHSLGSAAAHRLHGLAYINGWGVPVDQETGFKMVVESIEEEKAWDQATKIFEECGLNKPEFFSSIMAIKQQRGK